MAIAVLDSSFYDPAVFDTEENILVVVFPPDTYENGTLPNNSYKQFKYVANGGDAYYSPTGGRKTHDYGY